MNDVIQPPAERDLPPRRAARMRAELLAATAAPGRARSGAGSWSRPRRWSP